MCWMGSRDGRVGRIGSECDSVQEHDTFVAESNP